MADATSLRQGARGSVLLAAAAALPVVAATERALSDGWTPSSDDGVVALRAFDVISANPPLVGQFSQSSSLIGEPTYSLGPMLYWLLALPAHIGPVAIVLTMGAVGSLCLVGAVLLAARRGGLGLAVVVAIALIAACRSIPVEVPYEIWNAWSAVFPFTLLLFVAWSVACGDHRLLPLLALIASFVVQAHLTYFLPALLVVAIAVAGLIRWRRRTPGTAIRAWAIAAVAVTIVCWGAPAIDQLTREGNIENVVALATDDHQTAGIGAGLRTTARTVGIPPWWVLEERNQLERLEETSDVPLTLGLSAALVVGALLAALLAAVRRRRHDLAVAVALALALCVSVAFVAASVPRGNLGFSAMGYVLVWTSPAGMWIWMALAWSGWELLRPARATSVLRRPAAAWAVVGVVAVLAVVVATGRDHHAAGRLPPGLKEYELIDATAERVAAAVAGSDGVRIDVSVRVRNSLTFQSAIAYALRREGLSFSVPKRLVKEMGKQYGRHPGYEHVLEIRDGDAPPGEVGRVLVRNRHVSVILARR